MSKIAELIQEKCPNGVPYKKIREIATTSIGLATNVTKWKRSKGVQLLHNSDIKQNKIVVKNYEYIDEKMAQKNKSKVHELNDIITVHTGDVGTSAVITNDYVGSIGFTTLLTKINDIDEVNPFYLCHYLNSEISKQQIEKVTISDRNNLNQKSFNELVIPIPPIEVQEEIVRILDKFSELKAELEAELEARKKQYEFYLNKLINRSGKIFTLGSIGKISMCKRIFKNQTTNSGDIPFYKIGTFGKKATSYISKKVWEEYKEKYSYPKKGDILISAAGTIGKTVIFDGTPSYFQDSNIVWIENDETKVLNKYLYYFYQTNPWVISSGGTISRIYNDDIAKIKISIPPQEEQNRIVNILDKFDKLINDISAGLPAEIEARRKQYEYYRNKLLNFEELKDE